MPSIGAVTFPGLIAISRSGQQIAARDLDSLDQDGVGARAELEVVGHVDRRHDDAGLGGDLLRIARSRLSSVPPCLSSASATSA